MIVSSSLSFTLVEHMLTTSEYPWNFINESLVAIAMLVICGFFNSVDFSINLQSLLEASLLLSMIAFAQHVILPPAFDIASRLEQLLSNSCSYLFIL